MEKFNARLVIGLIAFLASLSAMSAPKIEVGQRNPFLKSRQLTQNNLDECPINSLKLVGTMQQGKELVAVVKNATNTYYFVKLNAVIGLEKAKITQISAEEIILEWQVKNQAFIQRLEV